MSHQREPPGVCCRIRSSLRLMVRDSRCYSRFMRFGHPHTITFLRHARWALLLAALTGACAQTSQVISLNGTWDFAFAADEAAADRLGGFQQEGFQGGGFRPITVPSNWALLGFEEPIYSRARRGGDGFYALDRKSTRLNSSHLVISYAVFCLKK